MQSLPDECVAMLGWAALSVAVVTAVLGVLHSPGFLRRPLPATRESGNRKTNVLLLVAHPDDESMFFAPTLLSLAQLGTYSIRVLCLSTGNADGLGARRKLEMIAACSVLKVPAENVEVVDHPALQDGFASHWDQSLILKLVREAVTAHNIHIILTFDNRGISGHPNHCSVSGGVRAFLLDEARRSINKGGSAEEAVQCWELVSAAFCVVCSLYIHQHVEEHDSLTGLDDIRDWTNNVRPSIPIYVTLGDLQVMEKSHYYVVDTSVITKGAAVFTLQFQPMTEEPFLVHGLKVTPLPVSGYRSLGLRIGKVCYISDASEIPAETYPLMEDCDLLILDAVRPDRSSATHFGMPAAVDEVRKIRPKRTLFTGMMHMMDHDKINAELAELSETEGLDIQVSYDGMQIAVNFY